MDATPLNCIGCGHNFLRHDDSGCKDCGCTRTNEQVGSQPTSHPQPQQKLLAARTHGQKPYTVVLKQKWDYTPHIDDFLTLHLTNNPGTERGTSQHCHVVRVKEMELLMDFFRRRVEGALLVSGKRGVGKTSAICSAIISAYNVLKGQSGAEIELFPVLVNAPNFETRTSMLNENDKPEPIDFLKFKRIIMQNLVRGLYQTAEKHGIVEKKSQKKAELTFEKDDLRINNLGDASKITLKNDISNLFMKAVAVKATEEASDVKSALQKYRLEKEFTTQMSWKLVATAAITSVSLGLVAAFSLPSTAIWGKVLPIVIATVPPSIAMTWQKKKTTANESNAEQNAKSYYLFDYDLSTLQSDLEETLRTLTKFRYKVIFVIDELDKMERDDVIEATKSLKPLFNQTAALFVLISGEEIFKSFELDSERGTEYTLFSQKIFLPRPQFEELRKFMDYIVDLEMDGQTLLKLFYWDQIDNTARLGDLLRESSIDYGDLNSIKDATITKEDDNTITIMVEDGSNPTIVKIQKEEKPQTSILTLKNNEVYEFAVMKDGDRRYVYTRSKEYRDFQHYAMYASRSDFFDLYNVLRDSIFYSSNELHPNLDIKLEPEQLMQAKLQQIMGIVYSSDQRSHPSEWHENDLILTLMYQLISKLAELKDAKRIRIEKKLFTIFFLDNKGAIIDQIPSVQKKKND